MAESDHELCRKLNKLSRPPGIEVKGTKVTIHGYQEFKITPWNIEPLPTDEMLRRKQRLAEVFFNGEFLTGRTVLDIGANGGFFSLWACQSGASEVVSLDMDTAYLDVIGKAQSVFGWKNIRPINGKAQDWHQRADLVLAFAMVHWLYSYTANFGSLEAVVAKLASLSRSILLIEWVAPDDAAILSFKHTEWNPQVDKAGYNLEAFEAALSKHFCKVEILGASSATRTLYACYQQPEEVTLHAALPLLAPAERVISSRCLTEYHGTKYYSRVYGGATGDVVIKQATAGMAAHEAGMLERLQGVHFPRVISSEQCDGYSVLVMERIAGTGLAEGRADISSTPRRLAGFLRECLAILSQLRAATIRHRDIRAGNILVRDGHPVLIDFGWAETEDEPYLSPGHLGGLERIPSGPACDTYSMGRVFEQIIPQNSKLFAPLLQMMLTADKARGVGMRELEQVLNGLELPERWDVPLEFAIPRQLEVQPGETEIKTRGFSAARARFWKRCRAFWHQIFRA